MTVNVEFLAVQEGLHEVLAGHTVITIDKGSSLEELMNII